MMGPVLGGLLWPAIGVGGCLLLLAVGYVVNFYLYLGVPPAPPARAAGTGPVMRNLAEGVAYAFRNPVILGVLVITAVMNLLGFPYQQLAPVMGKQVLELGPQLTGLLLSADGLGALTASLLIASRRDVRHKGRIFVIGSVLLLAAVLAFSLSRQYLLSFALLFLAGVGVGSFATMQTSLILTSASDAMRGRAMGALMLAIGFGPLGVLLIGVAASALGTPAALTLTAGTALLLLAVILPKAPTLWRLGTDL